MEKTKGKRSMSNKINSILFSLLEPTPPPDIKKLSSKKPSISFLTNDFSKPKLEILISVTSSKSPQDANKHSPWISVTFPFIQSVNHFCKHFVWESQFDVLIPGQEIWTGDTKVESPLSTFLGKSERKICMGYDHTGSLGQTCCDHLIELKRSIQAASSAT